VFENIAQGLPDEDRQRRSADVLRRVCEALEAVNLEPGEVINDLPAELSGGMRKRVGLARAIVGRPQIILYDEPVTGLDPVNSAVVNLLITDIQDQLRVTSVVVTHDIEQALNISQRVALLEHGRIRFVGPPDAFRSSPDPVVRAFADRRAATAVALKMMEES
jgi:phospholipid/cholesterol/gamma-HCH transport system ATP-binding protein